MAGWKLFTYRRVIMSERHVYNFDGGEKLTSMGATWFVSYLYHKKIDKNHVKWEKFASRRSTFEGTEMYHKDWLEHVLNMSDEKLNTNDIGLKAPEIKRMAKELLAKS
jgi:hypothetical protein